MPKKSKIKRILKIIIGVIIFFTLPTLLFFGFMYLKYNEELPTGHQGQEADQLALTMLETLDEQAYKNTDYLEWTFKNRHHYKWYKSEKRCEVYRDDFKVILDLENHDNSIVFVIDQEYNGIEKHDYIHKAERYFNNDSFWLVAPYKVFDKGVERRLIKTEDNKNALLVTYTSGGSTPGDSYLWHFDDTGKPKSYQMWTQIVPIDGLEATWSDWITTESGAQLPNFHKLLFMGLEMGDVKGIQNKTELKDGNIINLDVVFEQTGILHPMSIQDMGLRKMYKDNDQHLYQKTITNRTFLNDFHKTFIELKPTNEDGSFMDSRFSVLINYKSKSTDTLGLGEDGTIELNNIKYEFNESLVSKLKDELKYYIKYND